MTKEELEKEAVNHCNEVLCSVCENVTCTEHLQCREWRDRRAGYYCGAEPREKRIKELENKIADIKANCDLAIEDRDIKIKELEKKNSKLESDFRICEKNADTYYDQLTKATDLLKKFIETSNPIYFEKDRQKVKAEAEQFIKEIEK